MADQKITELPIKTSTGINLADYLLGIDSAEGYQMLVSDIAKKIVEDYAGSTLLGQSQSVQSALGAVESLSGAHSGAIVNDTDLNMIVTEGVYSASNTVAKSVTNGPTGLNAAFKLRVERSLGVGSTWLRQTLTIGASTYTTYRRYSTNNGSTWDTWEQMPTRAEMDSVVSKLSGISGIFNTGLNITRQSTGTFNVPSNSNHFLIMTGASDTVFGLLFVSAKSSNGEVVFSSVTAGSDLTVTSPSANTLTVDNAYANTCYVYDICLRGSAITVQTAGTNSAQSESI